WLGWVVERMRKRLGAVFGSTDQQLNLPSAGLADEQHGDGLVLSAGFGVLAGAEEVQVWVFRLRSLRLLLLLRLRSCCRVDDFGLLGLLVLLAVGSGSRR